MHNLIVSNIKAFLLLVIASSFIIDAYPQKLTKADSLEIIFTEGHYDAKNKLHILKQLSAKLSDPEKKLYYSDKLIFEATSMDSVDFLFSGYFGTL